MGVSLFALVFFSLLPAASAQTTNPEFLLTWKASGSYVPATYPGKALPTFGSKVTASLELLSQGKVLNIKGQTIYWYLNGTLIGGGVGAQQITFTPFGAPPSALSLEVDLPNYNGSLLVHKTTIFTVKPRAIIYAPYPYGTVSVNPISIRALPYFFNASSAAALSFTWTVNGQAGDNAANPDQAEINLPTNTPYGTTLALTLAIKNTADSTTAAASTNLFYQKQL